MTSIDFLNKVHKSLDSQEYNLSYSPAKSKNYMLYCNGNFIGGLFDMVFLSRILEKALADSGQNPAAHFLAGELLDFFSCILQCFHDGDEMEHASPLPCFSDLLKEEYLWSEEYDEEEDEMRYEEDEVFPDDLFYSFYYYSWQAVKAYQDVLEQVPAEFAKPAAEVLELL